MSKRSSFARAPRDFYPTPAPAVLPLLPHLHRVRTFIEPCAGNGALVDHLTAAGLRCVHASDIHPLRNDVLEADAFTASFPAADAVIVNPPWDRPILHRMIPAFIQIAPTWLLLDADWLHTKQAGPFMPMLRKIVSVGRVRWIPNSKMTGKDNCAWMLFGTPSSFPAEFFGRTSNTTEGSFAPAR